MHTRSTVANVTRVPYLSYACRVMFFMRSIHTSFFRKGADDKLATYNTLSRTFGACGMYCTI